MIDFLFNLTITTQYISTSNTFFFFFFASKENFYAQIESLCSALAMYSKALDCKDSVGEGTGAEAEGKMWWGGYL